MPKKMTRTCLANARQNIDSLRNKTHNFELKCIYITFNGLMDPLGQSQVLPYIKELNKRGIKFYLISLEKKRNLKEAKKIRESLKLLDINWYKLRYFGHSPIKILFSIFQSFLLAFYLIIFKKIDVIHARAYYSMFSVLFLKKMFNLKLIFDMRGFAPENLVDTNTIKKNSIYYKLLKFLEKKSILAADYLVTLTPEAIKIIRNNYKNKAIKALWMPTCVDEDRFKTKEREILPNFNNKFVVVYLGSLWSYYNMSAMIDFFNILKSKITNAHFLILGNNETEKLSPLLLKKGVKKKEYTILTIKPAEVSKYLKSSDLGIGFIYDFYSTKASFPTKFAEYLISGLPVVINTQCSFLKKIIISNRVGIVIEKFNKKVFQEEIEKLIFLLKDKLLKERCKKIAKKYLAKEVCIKKYLEIYKFARQDTN